MANQLRRAIIAVSLAGGLALMAPAQAAKDLSGIGATPPVGAGMTLFGGEHGIDNTTIGDRRPAVDVDPDIPSVPEPAGWLMMLLGFGLLGVMTRRGTPPPVEIQTKL